MKQITLLVILLLSSLTTQAAVNGENIHYRVDGKPYTGYLAYDDAIQGKRPGVLVVHEWWGLNAYARKRADMLAALGYTALAIDMYGTGKQADHPEDAKKFMQAVISNMPVSSVLKPPNSGMRKNDEDELIGTTLTLPP